MRHRAVVGNDVKLTRTFYVGKDATDADGQVVVVVTREDGTALAGGNATAEVPAGEYTFTLGAATHLARLDELRLRWTGVWGGLARAETDLVDVVGGRIFELHELGGLEGLEAFTVDALEAARRATEDAIEEVTGVSWIRRYARDRRSGDGRTTALLRRWPARAVLSATIDGAAQDTATWTVDESGVLRTGATPLITAEAGQNVDVLYEHGHDAPPSDLSEAGLRWARQALTAGDSQIPDRASLVSYDWGTFRLSIADMKHPSGIPDVDAVLHRYDRSTIGIA